MGGVQETDVVVGPVCDLVVIRQNKIPVGPVTGYRAIGEWVETEGRVTRNFYSLTGGERTHPEVGAGKRRLT